MSIRTIIEINHDLSHRAESDPVEFLSAFMAFTASANPRTAERLERFGFRVVESVHHSTDRKVVIMGKEFPL